MSFVISVGGNSKRTQTRAPLALFVCSRNTVEGKRKMFLNVSCCRAMILLIREVIVCLPGPAPSLETCWREKSVGATLSCLNDGS